MGRLHKSLSNIDTIKHYLKGEKTNIQISNFITEKEKFRKDGDEWEINGIQYKKENGKTIQVTKTKGDLIRDLITEKCQCGQIIKWGSKYDEKFFRRTGLCENCIIDFETKLRIIDAYPDYEIYKLSSYKLGHLKEAKEKLKEIVNYFENDRGDVTMICDETGFTERWKNTNRIQILKDSKRDLKVIRKNIAELTKLVQQYKAAYIEKAVKFNVKILN